MSDQATEEVLATFSLQLIGPRQDLHNIWRVAVRPDWIAETEENLTDLLPPGYSVRIKEWDDE